MLPATPPDIECEKYQNNIVVQATELTGNINCRFDGFELDTPFFKVISLSMSGSLAGGISCMLAKKTSLGSSRRYVHS